MPAVPYTEVHCDEIGPWTCKIQGNEVKVQALTMVDPVTNLVEIIGVYLTSAKEALQAFVKTWLLQYPVPKRVVMDGGPEFTGNKWEFMLQNWGLKHGRIMAHTPTANSIMESSHRSMGQVL